MKGKLGRWCHRLARGKVDLISLIRFDDIMSVLRRKEFHAAVCLADDDKKVSYSTVEIELEEIGGDSDIRST